MTASPASPIQKLSADSCLCGQNKEDWTLKITQVKLGRIPLTCSRPFQDGAAQSCASVEDVIVELHTDTGAGGYGVQYLESLLSLNHYIRYTVGEEEIAIQNCMDDGDILIDRLEDTTRTIRLLTESLARYDAIIATGNISNAVQEQYNNISQRLETSCSTEESILKDLSDLGYQFTRDPDSEYDYVVTPSRLH